MDAIYIEAVRLLLEAIPVLFKESRFAMKGGTAINLFVQDLPRLSVDVDVVFTDHKASRDDALRVIGTALEATQKELNRRGLQADSPVRSLNLGLGHQSGFRIGEHWPRKTDLAAEIARLLRFASRERRHNHLGFARVGAMHGFAVAPEGLPRETFGIATTSRPLRPCVAVGMERCTLNVQSTGAPHEIGRAVAGPNGSQIGEERSVLGQALQNALDLGIKANERVFPGLLSGEQSRNPRFPEVEPALRRHVFRRGPPLHPPGAPPQAKLLIALHTVRSERHFCAQLRYNLLFRWFLDMDMSEERFDASTFSQNQERLIQHDAARLFFHHV